MLKHFLGIVFLTVLFDLLAKCQSSPINELGVKLESLPILDLYKLWVHDNDSITVGWRPIRQRELNEVDKDHPIIGIKYIHTIPETIPRVITVGPNVTSVDFTDIKTNIYYQIRAQVFTDQGLGPYSDPSGFKVLENKKKPEDDEQPPPFIKGKIMKP